MRSKFLYTLPPRKAGKTALMLAILLLAGCSSNTMRFTDGMFTHSTSDKKIKNKPMPQQPISPTVSVQNQSIESRTLPPIEATSTASNQEETVQVAGLGAPPRNLGTLSASEVKPPVMTETGSRYIVQSGDTLSRIAYQKGVTITQLRQANALTGDTIRIGQSLTIPGAVAQAATGAKPATERVVQSSAMGGGSTSSQPVIAETKAQTLVPNENKTKPEQGTASIKVDETKTAATEKKSEKEEQVAVLAPQASGIAALRWPAKGRILSSFGQREGSITNDGIDIMVPEGTPVKAAENGVVIYAGDGLKEFGNTILVRHEDNIVTVYGHNGQLLVQRGQKVRRGDEIAKSGKSGNATTPKLHFEVRKNSTPVNPMKYLES